MNERHPMQEAAAAEERYDPVVEVMRLQQEKELILAEFELRKQWIDEAKSMREEIKQAEQKRV